MRACARRRVRVASGNGVELTSGGRTILLDPKRAAPDAVVTHGHTDHLVADAHMTPPTLGFLRVRKPTRTGTPVEYGRAFELQGMSLKLRDAGHVLGSAMVEVDTPDGKLVYTGDYNPRSSLLCEAARPLACDVLVTESTYGDPRFDLPPRELVLGSLETWALARLLRGPVALGAYALGRAQELIFLANRAGITPIVSPEIGAISAVYNAHGHDLGYAVAGSPRAQDLDASGGALHIVPRDWLKRDHEFARGLVARGGSAAYLSGWCHRFSYFGAYAIDAQFTLSDHASFGDLVAFVEATRPKQVYTMHGAAKQLAKEIRARLDIKAEPLQQAAAPTPSGQRASQNGSDAPRLS